MSTQETKKPWALVTGASRGIGAAIAKKLALDGFHVALNYSSSEARARELCEALAAAGGSAEPVGFDVAQSAQVDEKIDALTKTYGPMAVLVNNAGITIDSNIPHPITQKNGSTTISSFAHHAFPWRRVPAQYMSTFPHHFHS